MAGVAAMAAAGAHVLVEDSFVSGPVAQQPRKPVKATPAARTENSRVAAPRWHSFLPGMFR